MIGPYFVNWTSYRQDFEREASRILGQKVEVLGSAEARLLPFPSVTFNNVRVVNPRTGETMMSVAHFSMDAELAPFLRGEILIFDMRIDRPTGTVRLLKDGTMDWALRNGESLPGKSIVLENIDVKDGEIDLVDEQHDRTQQITKLNAKMSADSLSGPWHMEGTAALDGHGGAFSIATGKVGDDGKLKLRARLLPDEEPISVETDGEAGFNASKPGYDGQFTLQVLDLAAISGHRGLPKPNGEHQPAVARATGKFALDNARLRVDQYRLEIGPPADPYVVTGEATVDTGDNPNFLLTATGQQIDIDQLNHRSPSLAKRSGEAAKGNRPAPATTPAGRLAVLHRIGDLIPIPPMPGKVSIKLPAVVAGDTTVRDIAIDAEPAGDGWKIDGFNGKFPGRTEVEAKGRLGLGNSFGFVGHLLVAARQPSGLAEWLTGSVDPQIRLLNAAGFSADVTLSSDVQRFQNLELAIGPSTIKGGFERMASAGAVPSIAMNLSGNNVNLDAVRALAGLFTGKKNGISLAGASISAKLKADNFEAFGAQASNVDAQFDYEGGTLAIDHLGIGSLAGAALSLTGTVHGLEDTPSGTLHATIDSDNPKQLLTFAQVVGGPNALVDRMAGAASAFDDTHLDVTATAASGKMKLDATGHAGGSDITLAASRPDTAGGLYSVPLAFELTVQNPSVNKLLRQIGFTPLPIDAAGPGLLSLRLDGTPKAGAQVAFSLSGGDTRFDANGRMTFPNGATPTGELALHLKSDDLSPYLIMNGFALPESPTGMPADLKGKLSLGDDVAAISGIEGSVVGNAVSGDLSVTRQRQPMVTGRLSLDQLDAGWFARLIMGPGSVETGSGRWSTDDFAPPQDLGADFDVDLAAGEAGLGYGPPARNFSGHFSLHDGELDVDAVKASWLGGRLTGTFKLSNSASSGLMSTQIVLKDADLAQALGMQQSSAMAHGKIDLSGTLQGSGKSARALVNGLSGSGAASLRNLTIKGIRTNGLAGIIRAVDANKNFKISEPSVRRLADKAISGGAFDAGDLSVPFTVSAGHVRVADIAMSDADARVSGGGNIDLADATVDADFAMLFQKGADGFGGGTPALALHYAGPLADPHRSLDASDLSNYLSLRAYEIQRRKVELIQAGVMEKQRQRREIELLRHEADIRARDKEILLEENRRRAAALAAERAAAEEARKAEERAKAEAEARKKSDDTPPADSPPAQNAMPAPPADNSKPSDMNDGKKGAGGDPSSGSGGPQLPALKVPPQFPAAGTLPPFN